MTLGIRGAGTQNPAVQSQEAMESGSTTSKTSIQVELQLGAGALQNRRVGVGDAQQWKAMRAEFEQMQAELDRASYDAPYYRRNEFSGWDDEGIEVFNREQAFSRELKDAVNQREGGGRREAELRSELLQQVDELREGNASLSGEVDAGELKRDEVAPDEFFRTARALSEHSRGNSAEWLLLKSEGDLADAKAKLAALEAKIQETSLPDEERSSQQTKLEQLKADVAKLDARWEALKARLELKESAPTAEAKPHPVAVSGGEKREAALGWAAQAKLAFGALFAPLFNGLAALGRLAVELPSRVWSGLTGGGGPSKQLTAYLEKVIRETRLPDDDSQAASSTGNARHICHGMAKDIPRVDIFIGGENFRVRPDKEENSDEKSARERLLVEKTATALLAECGGNEALCMRVSNFAFQATESFWGLAAKERILSPEGVSSRLRFDFPTPKHHWIDVKSLGQEGVQLTFHAQNPAMEMIARVDDTPQGPMASAMLLDPQRSGFNGRFSIIVRPDLSVAPFPLNDGTAGDTPLSYEYHVTPEN